MLRRKKKKKANMREKFQGIYLKDRMKIMCRNL